MGTDFSKRLLKRCDNNIVDFADKIVCADKKEYREELDRLDDMVYQKLCYLEDKIENGTLIELPCKVGDTATAVIDTFAYDNSVQKVKIEGLAYIVKDENGDITFQHMSRLFHNEEEAEAKLKELKE